MQETSLSPGAEINVAAVADEAGISRATAYRYFSDSATLAWKRCWTVPSSLLKMSYRRDLRRAKVCMRSVAIGSPSTASERIDCASSPHVPC
ncbi:TetR family transcriptional regulator [Sinorhizobium meliloti]|nr:TetR family transcriptional regulator [Sinorhizobium meliloti]